VISAPESNHSSGVNFPVVKMNIPSMQSSPDGVTWIKYTSAAIPFQLQTIGSGQYTSATGNVTCLVEPGYNPATLYVPKSESTQQSDARVSYMFYGNLDHSATQRLLAYGSYTNNQRSFFTLGYDPVTCVMTTTTEVDGTLTTESATV